MSTPNPISSCGDILRRRDLPVSGTRVMVTTANYRCLGFLDAKGNWRHSFNQTILSDVVTWEAIGSALN